MGKHSRKRNILSSLIKALIPFINLPKTCVAYLWAPTPRGARRLGAGPPNRKKGIVMQRGRTKGRATGGLLFPAHWVAFYSLHPIHARHGCTPSSLSLSSGAGEAEASVMANTLDVSLPRPHLARPCLIHRGTEHFALDGQEQNTISGR